MDEYIICDKFLDNPNLNPEKSGSRLQKGAGPYRKYIARCQKLGGNHKIQADKLLAELGSKSNVIIPISPPKSNIPIPTPKLIIPTPIPKLTTQTKISTQSPIHKSNILQSEIPKLSILAQIPIPIHKSKLPIPIPIISKSTDIYDIYPAEIWNHILLDLNCKTAKSICSSSQQLNKLCENNDIIEKIKMKGFPRKSGHCDAFDVSKIIPEKYDISKMNSNEYENYEYEENPYHLSEYRDLILDKLYKLNFDLVRGDLICFEGLDVDRNEGIYIFDGCKIIDLDHEIDDYGALPSEFTVINNAVPFDYWQDRNESKYIENESIRGIDHNDIVWFDARSVKDQLIENIQPNLAIGHGRLFTTFIYDDVTYIIDSGFENYDEFSEEKFKNKLSSNNNLLLENEFDGNKLLLLDDNDYYYR